ncbi:MAG TPA: PrsW family glutamic-type intramembrane protease [Spirochaetales bacterium]|nr:PrsW family glutamic-type intramembrane protease [Spirochaetales bacterium]
MTGWEAALGVIAILAIDLAALVGWSTWLSRRDRYAPRKRRVAWLPVFVLAGMASAPLSVFAYGINGLWVFADATDGVVASFLYYTLFVAVSEEFAKFLAFYLATRLVKAYREPLDGALHGATVGLGFALVENFFYGLDFGVANIAIRSLAELGGHMAYTALSGAVWGGTLYWGEVRAERLWRGLPVLGVAAASLAHGLHNTIAYHAGMTAFLWDALVAFALARLVREAGRHSPYRAYPVAERVKALEAIGRGLALDPRSRTLLLRQGIYLAAGGDWVRSAASFRAAYLAPGGGHYSKALWAAARLVSGEADAREELEDAWRRMPEGSREAFVRTVRTMAGKDERTALAILEPLIGKAAFPLPDPIAHPREPWALLGMNFRDAAPASRERDWRRPRAPGETHRDPDVRDAIAERSGGKRYSSRRTALAETRYRNPDAVWKRFGNVARRS